MPAFESRRGARLPLVRPIVSLGTYARRAFVQTHGGVLLIGLPGVGKSHTSRRHGHLRRLAVYRYMLILVDLNPCQSLRREEHTPFCCGALLSSDWRRDLVGRVAGAA